MKKFDEFGQMLAPRALEIIEEPPIPIAIPKAAIKKEIGKTTLIAAIAVEPIQFPTKIVSTTMFNDITRIPIEAGADCFTNNLLIDSLPKAAESTFGIKRFAFLVALPTRRSNDLGFSPNLHDRLNRE